MNPSGSDGDDTPAARDIIEDTPDIWGADYSTESETVERQYDDFARTGRYDETFAAWGYVGPETAAAITLNYVPTDARVLDAACGSGLTGRALHHLGYRHLEGIDISSELLAIARETGTYERLRRVDMQDLPLPFDDDEFDAVCFIGALTYFEDAGILEELCRVVRPGGHVVFSQREDIMKRDHYESQLARLEAAGTWRRVFGTEPMPYLPGHPDYGTEIQVRYFVYEVT